MNIKELVVDEISEVTGGCSCKCCGFSGRWYPFGDFASLSDCSRYGMRQKRDGEDMTRCHCD